MMNRGRRRIAAGVSVLPHFDHYNAQFDAIVARDGRPPETFDLAPARFAVSTPDPGPTADNPIVGLCLRGAQPEYQQYQRVVFNEKADALLTEAAGRHAGKIRRIDTVLRPQNPPAKIVGDFTGSDIILTTRMHGALFDLCYGKPVIAIDQVDGSAKVTNVLTRIGWPLVFAGAAVTEDDIEGAVQRARSPEIRPVLEKCRAAMIAASKAAVDASVRAISDQLLRVRVGV